MGIFLFGVPNKGLNHGTNLTTIVKNQENEILIKELMTGAARLNDLNADFESSCQIEGTSIVSFYESKATKSVVLVST
jgi:hypothetical protein